MRFHSLVSLWDSVLRKIKFNNGGWYLLLFEEVNKNASYLPYSPETMTPMVMDVYRVWNCETKIQGQNVGWTGHTNLNVHGIR